MKKKVARKPFVPQWKTLTEVYYECRIPQPSLKMIKAAYHNAADLYEVAKKLCPKLGMDSNPNTLKYYVGLILRASKKYPNYLPQLPEKRRKERIREDLGNLIEVLQGI